MTDHPTPADSLAREELKPCPFCGTDRHQVVKRDFWVVECRECGAEIGHDNAAPAAIARWNRRVGTAPGAEGYQARVGAWMDDVFAASGADLRTRVDRYLEESFELAQALAYDPGRIAVIRDYVFSRPVGEPAQETGGVMVTLASLCHAAGIDMEAEAERELARVHTPEVRAKIMAKQASKNALHTPLPTAEAVLATVPPEPRAPSTSAGDDGAAPDIDAYLPQVVRKLTKALTRFREVHADSVVSGVTECERRASQGEIDDRAAEIMHEELSDFGYVEISAVLDALARLGQHQQERGGESVFLKALADADGEWPKPPPSTKPGLTDAGWALHEALFVASEGATEVLSLGNDVFNKAAVAFELARPSAPADAQGDAATESGGWVRIPRWQLQQLRNEYDADEACDAELLNQHVERVTAWLSRDAQHIAAPAPQAETPSAGEVG